MKCLTVCFYMISATAFGQVETVVALHSGRWGNTAVWSEKALPNLEQKVWVDEGISLIVKDPAEACRFVLGDGSRSGSLIIDGGTLNTRTREWVAVGYNSNAMLKIMNGGRLNTAGRMTIGLKDELNQSLTEVIVVDGSMHIDGVLEIGKTYDGVNDAGNKIFSVAILRITKGAVEAQNLLISDHGSCRINMEGGVIRLEGDRRVEMSRYIEDGRLFAHSKAPGSRILVEYSMGKTIITPERAAKTLGLVLAGLESGSHAGFMAGCCRQRTGGIMEAELFVWGMAQGSFPHPCRPDSKKS